MSPYARLGIARDASVLDIKRAYARQLKNTRPDEDPVGFQALHEAYTYCLDNVGQDDVFDEEAPELDELAHDQDEALPEADEAFAFSDAEQRLEEVPQLASFESFHVNHESQEDDERFLEDFLDRFAQDAPIEMYNWLNAHPAMFSIARKDAMRWDILDQMEQVHPPVSTEMMDVVKQFFGLDQVDFRAPWLIERLTALEYDLESARAYRALQDEFDGPDTRYFDRLIYRELSAPFNIWRRLFFMLMFGMPRRIYDLWQKFDAADPNEANARLNTGAVAFWRAVAQRNKIALPRFAVAALRILVWVPLASFPAFKSASVTTFASAEFWKTISGNMGVWAALWLCVALVRLATSFLGNAKQSTK